MMDGISLEKEQPEKENWSYKNGGGNMGKIYLEGADNTRDLGGLKTTEGAVIKDKHLIRSNRLSRITQKDKIFRKFWI